MFPSDMAMLIAIAITSGSDKELLIRPMDVVGEYIGYLYDSLVRHGYLKRHGSRGYQLTSKGMEALFDFLYKNKTRLRDTVGALQRLGIEINQEAGSPERQAIKVR